MSLPGSANYLALALEHERQVKNITLAHHQIGNLQLPTGALVACDPFVAMDAQPLTVLLPRGTFPVVLRIAQIANDQRVAFASIRLKEDAPVRWKMLLVGNQDASTLKNDEIFDYGVDAGTGCFMDKSAATALDQAMRANAEFYETLIAEMEKTYTHTWSWLDMKFGEGNLIAFSSGYGDGAYATYAGYNANGELCAVVTDFGVVPAN
jgi:hypothetical protein